MYRLDKDESKYIKKNTLSLIHQFFPCNKISPTKCYCCLKCIHALIVWGSGSPGEWPFQVAESPGKDNLGKYNHYCQGIHALNCGNTLQFSCIYQVRWWPCLTWQLFCCSCVLKLFLSFQFFKCICYTEKFIILRIIACNVT